MRVELPSGLVLELRPWTLGDMGAMAERASQPKTAGDDMLLDALERQFVAVLDPGPYPGVKPGDARPEFKKLLKADILWALYRVRAASHPDDPKRGLTGEDYVFEWRCPDTECDGQKEPQYTAVKLCNLKLRRLPSSSAEVMRSGRSFESKVAGRVVRWVLPTFALDAPLREHLKRERKRTRNMRRPSTPSEQIAAQMTYVEGVKNSDHDLAARARWLDTLEQKDWVPFRDDLTRAAPFVSNKVDMTCDACGRTTSGPLPLGPSFFAPPDPAEELLDADSGPEKKGDGAEETTTETGSPTSPPSPETTTSTSS